MMVESMPVGTREMGWRVPASILIGIGWLVFLIVWLFFYATNYSIWKNIGVVFASLIITLSLEATVWIGFGVRMGQTYSTGGGQWWAYEGLKWRAVLSTLVAVGWSVFFIIWLLIYADAYSGYQNLAVILVSVLIAAGLTAAMWTGAWRRRY